MIYVIGIMASIVMLAYLLLALVLLQTNRITWRKALKRAAQYIATIIVLTILFALLTVDWVEIIPHINWKGSL